MFVNKHVSLCDTDTLDVLAVVSLFAEAGRLLGMSLNTVIWCGQTTRHAAEGTDAEKKRHLWATINRHATISWGKSSFFSENLYQSVSFIYASMYRENVHVIHIAMQFAKKSRHCVIKIDNQQQRSKIGASFHVARQSD